MMKLTNFHNLPEPIVQLLTRLSYYQRKSDYSVTEFINPIRIALLTQRHFDEIVEDAADQIWKLLGILLHLALQQIDVKNHLQEEPIRVEVLDRVISGKPDLYSQDKRITDYKLTTVWSKIFPKVKEWTEQVNCYTWLYRMIGFEVDEAEIFVVYRDWSPGKAKASKDYPQRNNEIISITLWDFETQTKFVHSKVEALIGYEDTPDDELPECTAEEMWEKPTTYAVMREGRKRAIKLFEDIEEASEAIVNSNKVYSDNRGKFYMEVRSGERVRCESYCPVNTFCNQYKKYKEANK